MAKFNLSHPLQARRWLRLMVEDRDCGFRLAPNLNLPPSRLGFSFRSNAHGLHGPANSLAGQVIFGTSYAQGLAVNEGENWFEHCLPANEWLNLGLPVGIREWGELARLLHRGATSRAVIVYHPNIWIHCQMYERWRDSGLGVFAALHWKTGLGECVWLSLRRARRRRRALSSGDCLWFEHEGEYYDVDLSYAHVDLKIHQPLVDRNLDRLKKLLEPFRHVLVVRVPVKQELVPGPLVTEKVRRIIQNYDALWQQTRVALNGLERVEFHQPDIFSLSHYHAQDTHWNAAGNLVFAKWLGHRLGADGLNGAA